MKALRTLFNLYPGEGRAALPFLFLGLLWSLGAFGALTLSEGMFIEHIGVVQLPFSYLITAAVMCLFSSVLLLLLHHKSIIHLLTTVITAVCIAQLALYFLILNYGAASCTWYAFKVIGWVSPVMIYICFWAFIDQYYDLQSAKRCFCLFNAVLYLGDALAGGIISYFLHHIGIDGFLLFCTFSLILSIPIIFYIEKTKFRSPEETHDGNPPQNPFSLKKFAKKVLKSPFTILLMLFYFLMQLIAITSEYTYMGSFEKYFNAPYVLTEFLGSLAMWVSLLNMFFGLLFYSRTVNKIGVNNIILIAPLLFLSIFASWSWHETLLLATIALIAREAMAYTFDDNNLLLLISGVPSKVKNQVRISIESFFEPVGMLIASSLLFFFHAHSIALGLFLSLLSLFVAVILRSQYAKALFNNLIAHTLSFEKKTSDWMKSLSKKENKKMEIQLFYYLNKNDEALQLLAFEYLLKMENVSLLPRLLAHASKFSIRGKLHVIQLFSKSIFSRESIIQEKLEQWKKTLPHPQLKSAIYFYLAENQLLKANQLMPYLESHELPLRAAAILNLRLFPEKIAHSVTALESLNLLLHSTDEKEKVMGLTILGVEKKISNLSLIFSYLHHPSPYVAYAAGRALYLCMDKSCGLWIPKLMESLKTIKDSSVRYYCLKALEKNGTPALVEELMLLSLHFKAAEKKLIEKIVISWGEETIPTLRNMVQNKEIHLNSRLLAAKILNKISPTHLRLFLREIILDELDQAYFYRYYSRNLSKNEIDLDLSMLENALDSSFHSSLNFIVQMIALGGAFEEPEVLAITLQSKNLKIKGHAIETLEKASEPTLFALIKPLLQHENESYSFKKEQLHVSLNDLLGRLLHSPSIANKIVAETLKKQLEVEAL